MEVKEDQTHAQAIVKTLREKILKDKNLNFRTDDAFLLRFLRAKRFDVKRTFELMMNYYKQRDNHPQYYRKSLSDLKSSLSSNYQGALQDRDSQGRAIYILNSTFHWNPSCYSLEELAANSVLSLEKLIEDEDVQLNGLVVLIDMTGLSYKHILSINPLTLKKAVDSLIHTFPIRYKAVHYINEPYIFDVLFMMLKPFLSKKLLSRIRFHGGSLGNLHDYVSPDILPEEFGGTRGPFNNESWNDGLKVHEKTVKDNLKYGFLKMKRK